MISIKSCVEKLEGVVPSKGDGIKLLWHSSVRRDGNGLLWERPFHAVIVRLPAAPNETLERHESEGPAQRSGKRPVKQADGKPAGLQATAQPCEAVQDQRPGIS